MTTPVPREGAPNFPLSHRLIRLVWSIVWGMLASWTPPPMHAWRRFLLRCFGAQMAPRSDVHGSARVWYPRNLIMEERTGIGDRVDCYNMALITIRSGAIVSKDAVLCAGTHDIDDAALPLMVKPIDIGCDAWVAAGAFVGPGVTIGEGAVLGARAVSFRNLEAWGVYAGNPAAFIRKRIRIPPEIDERNI